MSIRPLIVMALPGESEGLVAAAGFQPIYTGTGKVNAAYGLTKALTDTFGKYVTDGADDSSHDDWQKHVTDAPHAFAALLRDYC